MAVAGEPNGEADNTYDLVIVGGTPGGVMTAVSASRLGKTALLLERTRHVGGLPANGLGATDIHTRGATLGLFQEFVNRIRAFYVGRYGEDSEQVKRCDGGYYFEPSVAEGIRLLDTVVPAHFHRACRVYEASGFREAGRSVRMVRRVRGQAESTSVPSEDADALVRRRQAGFERTAVWVYYEKRFSSKP